MKDSQIFLKHILESISDIETYLRDVSITDFMANKEKQDAVIRRVEIIGEAVRHLPEDFRKKYPEIPWQDIAGMRSKLIHEYFGVDYDLVWVVVKKDLPIFKEQIKELLSQKTLI